MKSITMGGLERLEGLLETERLWAEPLAKKIDFNVKEALSAIRAFVFLEVLNDKLDELNSVAKGAATFEQFYEDLKNDIYEARVNKEDALKQDPFYRVVLSDFNEAALLKMYRFVKNVVSKEQGGEG